MHGNMAGYLHPHLKACLHHPTSQSTSHLATCGHNLTYLKQCWYPTPAAATTLYPSYLYTDSAEGTQGQTAATAPSQLIQAIGTANTNEQGGLLCNRNVATVTKIITQPAQAPPSVNNISEDLGVNVPLNLKERIWNGEFIEMFQLIKKD